MRLRRCIWVIWIVNVSRAANPTTQPAVPVPGAGDLAYEIVQNGLHMAGGDTEVTKRLRERLAAAMGPILAASAPADRQGAIDGRDVIGAAILPMLEKSPRVVRMISTGGRLIDQGPAEHDFPGPQGPPVLRIENGKGNERCVVTNWAFSSTTPVTSELDAGTIPTGVVWVLVELRQVPAGVSRLRIGAATEDGSKLAGEVSLIAPEPARLTITVLSDDTGEPSPAMVGLRSVLTGAYPMPATAVDLAAQFDRQGTPSSLRQARIPGPLGGTCWCVSGPFEMTIGPGEWCVLIRRGCEHTPITETITLSPGESLRKTYRPQRWMNSEKEGWYSGDDHVHARLISDEDAGRIMTWVKAEDLYLANIVKMGDIHQTWFEQRGFGKPFRVTQENSVLAPGQECPRTHAELGHTLALNTTAMVRDTNKYFLYDWVADTVHAQGGLWGYAHVVSKMFHVDRDMSMNIPKGKCDFVEILQFGALNTDWYYEFLDLGYPVTASAGSDVPWCGTIGEARVYADLERAAPSADGWFEALRRGKTFVTDGPYIELRVEAAGPGETLHLKEDRKLRVRASARGNPVHMLPLKLQIIQLGKVIHTATGTSSQARVDAELEVNAGNGFWLAARVDAGDGTKAHTTPVYVVRDGLRFWNYEKLPELFKRRLSRLDEIEKLISNAIGVNDKGKPTQPEVWQMFLQSDALLQRVRDARRIYADLEETARAEAPLRHTHWPPEPRRSGRASRRSPRRPTSSP